MSGEAVPGCLGNVANSFSKDQQGQTINIIV